ncbi:hypothetical protein OV320_7835 [Actinobacteria bacterium OV320]|nr:hypothetical protein OV320_7835 [Actinobacteria bacterium OV320]
MIIKPTPAKISEMWWRRMATGRIMVIHAVKPSGERVQGDVISRGSMMTVRDHETGQWWEDVKSEWVISATLIFPRENAS